VQAVFVGYVLLEVGRCSSAWTPEDDQPIMVSWGS
jgi:hypothetical protein